MNELTKEQKELLQQQLKNAIGLVKQTKCEWFKENTQLEYFLTFSDDGNRMWIEPENSNNLTIQLSTVTGNCHFVSKNYIMDRLRTELIELVQS